ncbi:MAG: phosphatidylserine decarboxylase family protein [Desulfovibrio sp.]|nr:phosphatidylserine decarboxylase family protein [Desulfovibrio sp.]
MLKANAGITPEGRPAIFLCSLAALLAALLGCAAAAIFFFLLTLFCCNFFRDPERVVPRAPGLAVSPADGRIVKIAPMPDPFSGEPRQCVCIFMNLFSVHVNRSPAAGKITNIVYHEGKFFNASLDKASSDNERCAYALEDEDGKSWSMVQIAGLVARRIVCRAEVGDRVQRGERVGMIKFGSRVDLYLPLGWQAKVAPGQKVFAGLSVIAQAEAGR